MLEVANSWWMYLLGIAVVVFVLAGSVFFILDAFKEAKKINMDKKVLKKVIFNSTIFTILPSISILLGVIALSGTLGVPLPWIRLTVIGALHYEGAAASAAIDAFQSIGVTEMTNEVFVTIACVMTLGILVGPLYCLFGFKAYDKKILAKAKASEENEEIKEVEETTETDNTEELSNKLNEAIEERTFEPIEQPKKKKFGDVLFNVVFIAMISAFLAVDIAKLASGGETPMETYTPTVVILSTFGVMFILDIIERKFKQKWLSSFSLGIGMLVGMIVACLLG